MKFRKISEDRYEVRSDGELLGTVWKAWARNGGWGWAWSGARSHTVEPTRKEAARRLLKETR